MGAHASQETISARLRRGTYIVVCLALVQFIEVPALLLEALLEVGFVLLVNLQQGGGQTVSCNETRIGLPPW